MNIKDLNKGMGGWDENRSMNSKAYKSFNNFYLLTAFQTI